jgi:integrase
VAGIHRLSALKVKNAKPGKYGDGGGLWLYVKKDGRKTWVFKYTANGKRREMGLGPVHTVSLAIAREKSAACRLTVLNGGDPIEDRHKDQRGTMTFETAADAYINMHKSGWTNARQESIWRRSLEDYAYPVIGQRDVTKIDTDDILKILQDPWSTKTETATRVRSRIERVLDWCTSGGYRSGPNPARWKGHLSNLLPSPARVKTSRHFPALPWQELPGFMTELRQRKGVAAQALTFLILTAARSGEVRGMSWDELDLDDAIWVVPAERIKMKREHRVPLTASAIDVLMDMRQHGQSGLVFPSVQNGKQMSDMTLSAVLKRMDRKDITVHGFRSTFKDWASESTAYPDDVSEMALAHAVKNKVVAAYKRGDLFEKRRRLMSDWASYASGGADRSAEIATIRA